MYKIINIKFNVLLTQKQYNHFTNLLFKKL